MADDPDTRDAAAAQPITHLPTAAHAVLERARSAPARRAASTLTSGGSKALQQTLLALVAGHALTDHETPAVATLQVLTGTVRLNADDEAVELRTGDHVIIPPIRHGVTAVDDAVLLLTVGKEVRASGEPG